MIDCIGEFYDENGIITKVPENRSIPFEQSNSAYEVIRVIEGVPLFLEEHFHRLERSFASLGDALQFQIETLAERISRVVRANNKMNCNVKMIISARRQETHAVIYISKSYYPSIQEVDQGVAVDIMMWEREKPNAKVINQTYKQAVENTIKQQNVFEVLLVNTKKEITEGSRSNVFFVKDKTVYTAPTKQVLKGITRQYVLEACERANVQIIQKPITLEVLSDMEALFLTGTSIKVLPVFRVGDKKFDSGSHQDVIRIKDIYENMILAYINASSSRTSIIK